MKYMEIKPMRSEADHEAALRRIETLWGAASGTTEGDELDVLATLVEAYEREHCPVDLPTPLRQSDSAWSRRERTIAH